MSKKEFEPIMVLPKKIDKNLSHNNKEWLNKNKELILELIRKELTDFNKYGDKYQERKSFMPATTKFTQYIIAKACEELNNSAYKAIFYEQFGSAIKQMYYDESRKEKMRDDLESLGVNDGDASSRQDDKNNKVKKSKYKSAGRFIEMSQPRERE